MTVHERATTAVRLRILLVCVACLFAALFARLWFLQVIEGPAARLVAASNGIRYIYTSAPRGLILDRNGRLLVGNTEELVVDVDQQTAARQPKMLRRLALLLGMTVPQLESAVHDPQYSPYAPVPVMRNPTPDQVLQIQEYPQRFPGVTLGREWVRAYTQAGVAAANVVGYVGRITAGEYKTMKAQGYRPDSTVGQSGIEATYQSVLRGKPGVEEVEVDARGNVLSTLRKIPPVPGENIRLSIDGTVQEAAVQALAQETALKRKQLDSDGSGNFRASTGAVVVEDPSSGQLVALATYPSYDPALFAGGITQSAYAKLTSPASHYPLEDRAVGGEYFPGSTFKLVTATAGLESGVITPTSLYDDVGGGITVGGHFFANDGHQSYGYVALPFAITVSDDAYFYHIGETLYDQPSRYGTNTFQNTAYSYGFGRPTGVALAGEASGYVLTPQQKAALHRQYPKAYPYGTYYTGDAIQSAIGEEDVAVTPLQLANAYAAFANGGTLYRPSLVLDAETAGGKVLHQYPATRLGRTPALTPAERQAMIAGFVGVTSNPLGTAYGSFGKTNYPIAVAGKTGTAQVVSGIPHTSPAYKQTTSVFTSFAPAYSPQYVVDCFMPQAGYGAAAAAPVVRQVYDVLFHQPILPTPLSGY
ncbi:MAG TPA: penicillin-binding protein 2 [Acidimicrobiales bacterium]|nr:penicillin-binding protein 2 [Acidimicrobiales bacterium]